MKKILVVLSLVCFTAFISKAQEPNTNAPVAKKEASVSKDDAKAGVPACCAKANKACCKSSSASKACTPEQKAACAKAGAEKSCAGHSDKAKAEAAAEKTEAVSPNKN